MQSKDLLKARLDELDQVMQNLPKGHRSFMKTVAFFDSNFSELIRQKLLKYIDIFSLMVVAMLLSADFCRH